MDDGICYIKEEFLLPSEHDTKREGDENSNKRKLGDDKIVGESNPTKRGRFSKTEKRRGQNKDRVVFKDDKNLHLCNSLINGPGSEKCSRENCKYVHDIDTYLKNKPADIDSVCPIFKFKGFCPRGVTCRFSKNHIAENNVNIKASYYKENEPLTTINGITSEMQVRLRKYQYDFSRAENLVERFEKELAENAKNKTDIKNKITDNVETKLDENISDESKNVVKDDTKYSGSEKPTGLVVDEETNGRDINIKPPVDNVETKLDENISDESKNVVKDETKYSGSEKPTGFVVDEETNGRDINVKPPVDFSNKLILSPLTTVGNLPFRRICKEFGADITCGEMACSFPIVKGISSEWALTKRHVSEDIFGVQICGSNPKIIAKAAQLLQETTKIDYIDLNIGCPIDLIYQHGGGCALMRRTRILEVATKSCSALSPNIPFTVKMRTGIYADQSVAHEIAPLVEEWGAAAVTIHGRSREQRYMKYANWEYIEEVASKVKRIPVIGNGDIFNYEDYNERKRNAPHVSSMMIGRGALIKPWLFKEIKEQKPWDPSSSERFDLLKKYVNYGLEHWGSDTKGVENTRRFLLEWQSFLYRYVPLGLIAKPPHKINQRPQKFRGRDEMETLMCSANSSDWVKISEMLLGPVPDGYTFVPKHKANAY